jgi:hypothetical protein
MSFTSKQLNEEIAKIDEDVKALRAEYRDLGPRSNSNPSYMMGKRYLDRKIDALLDKRQDLESKLNALEQN